jgi:hypothetical protein
LVVLGRHVEHLAFLQVLLGDLPALTKGESFYQRLLVGDTDDLQEQAEEVLKETTLSSYYDEVAIPGVEMAARDLARGVLTDAHGTGRMPRGVFLNRPLLKIQKRHWT